MATKQKIEVLGSGCPLGNEAIDLVQREAGPEAEISSIARLADLFVSLIQINLRQFRFVVTFTGARACCDGVPKCATTASTTSNHGPLGLVTS